MSEETILIRLRRCSSRLIPALSLAAATSFSSADIYGSLWESSTWAMTSDVIAEVGYDSNLFARNNGDGDVFVNATPSLRFKRKASATYLNVDLSARARHFLDNSDQDSVDPTLKVTYRFPDGEESLTSHEAEFLVESVSYANFSVGDRTRSTTVRGQWDGTLRDTGKTQILAGLGAEYLDYPSWGTENWTTTAGIGAGWLRTELMQLYANYEFEYEDVSSSRVNGLDSTRTSHGASVGIRGEISPKLEGRARFGVRQNSFSGDVDTSDWDWFARAHLTWRLHERRSFTLTGSRANRFDANGFPYTNTYFDLSMYQGITSLVSAQVRVGWFQYRYIDILDGSQTDREDSQIQVGGSLNYRPSGRFNAGVLVDWYSKDSNLDVYTFNRYRISARATFFF